MDTKVFDNVTEIIRDDMATTIKKAVKYRLQLLIFLCMHTKN